MEVSQSSPAQLQQVISPSAKKPRPADQESTADYDLLEVGPSTRQVLPAHFAPTARVFVRDIACSGTVDKVLWNSDALRGYKIIYDPVDASLDQMESGNHPWRSVFRMLRSPENWPADAFPTIFKKLSPGAFERIQRGVFKQWPISKSRCRI